MSDVAVVLDTSALLSYVDGNIAVGELIAEIADEARLVAIPATCLAQARAIVADDLAAAHLLLLTTTPTVVVIPLATDQFGRADPIWRVGEIGLVAAGDVGVGHAVHAALVNSAYYVTARPDLVDGVLPHGWVVLDVNLDIN